MPFHHRNGLTEAVVLSGSGSSEPGSAICDPSAGPAAASEADAAPSDRFPLDDPLLLSFLEENGYVVVSNIASKSELQELEQSLWDFLEDKTTLKRGDMTTWCDDDSLSGICDRGAENGIIHKGGIGQSVVQWRARVLAKKVFEEVWEGFEGPEGSGPEDSSDLISSFDGACVFRPWQHGIGPKTIARKWLHTDQGRRFAGRRVSVQGLLTLYDQTEATGGLRVVPGSHRHHKTICNYCRPSANCGDASGAGGTAGATGFVEFPSENRDYIEIPEEHEIWRELRMNKSRIVRAKAGDFVLWDSRTLHCNSCANSCASEGSFEGQQAAIVPKGRLLRAVSYVSMQPRAWASDAELRLRQRGFCQGRTSAHWPCLALSWDLLPIDDEETARYEAASPAIRDLI